MTWVSCGVTRLTGQGAAEQAGARRAAAPSTSRRELRLIALRLFAEHGFDSTTIEQIAAEAGVSERTFFRYFTTQGERAVERVRDRGGDHQGHARLGTDDVPMMDAIRGAVVAANHYQAGDVPEMRLRMHLHRDGARAVVQRRGALRGVGTGDQRVRGRRLGQPAESLYPLTVGRCRARRLPRGLRPLVGPRGRRPDPIYLDAALDRPRRRLRPGLSIKQRE